MIIDILKKFINNIPEFHKLEISKKDIIECTIPSIEEVEGLPKSILQSDEKWWLRSPGINQRHAAVVNSGGDISEGGSAVYYDNYAVRPLLITNLKSSNLKIGDICKIFGINWYYIGDGKFLSVNSIGYHRFNNLPYFLDYWNNKISREEYFELCKKAELNNYEKSELKDYVDDWFNNKLKTLDESLNEGFYDKEVYERKRAYAQRMRDKDREDAIGLTDEQCDVLDWLCTIRHEMHSNQEDMFYSESPNNEKFLRWIDSEINEELKDVGLSTIKFSHDAEDFPDDYTWELDYDDYEKAYYDCIDMAEDINKDIEHYLAKIDEEHNTHYYPTGASRIF